jgi:hypothetical protein
VAAKRQSDAAYLSIVCNSLSSLKSVNIVILGIPNKPYTNKPSLLYPPLLAFFQNIPQPKISSQPSAKTFTST